MLPFKIEYSSLLQLKLLLGKMAERRKKEKYKIITFFNSKLKRSPLCVCTIWTSLYRKSKHKTTCHCFVVIYLPQACNSPHMRIGSLKALQHMFFWVFFVMVWNNFKGKEYLKFPPKMFGALDDHLLLPNGKSTTEHNTNGVSLFNCFHGDSSFHHFLPPFNFPS